jgi:hypothetical protein
MKLSSRKKRKNLYVFITVSFELFVFHGLVQFRDAKLQPFYLSFNAVSLEHHERDNLTEANA